LTAIGSGPTKSGCCRSDARYEVAWGLQLYYARARASPTLGASGEVGFGSISGSADGLDGLPRRRPVYLSKRNSGAHPVTLANSRKTFTRADYPTRSFCADVGAVSCLHRSARSHRDARRHAPYSASRLPSPEITTSIVVVGQRLNRASKFASVELHGGKSLRSNPKMNKTTETERGCRLGQPLIHKDLMS
jgi:hypothetical protein